jgi:hypothetical protein
MGLDVELMDDNVPDESGEDENDVDESGDAELVESDRVMAPVSVGSCTDRLRPFWRWPEWSIDELRLLNRILAASEMSIGDEGVERDETFSHGAGTDCERVLLVLEV